MVKFAGAGLRKTGADYLAEQKASPYHKVSAKNLIKRGAVIEAARDLVALWRTHKISGLPRSERNAAIEGVKERLIATIEALDA